MPGVLSQQPEGSQTNSGSIRTFGAEIELDDHGYPGRLEVGEGPVPLRSEALGPLQGNEPRPERLGNRPRVIGHVLADVVQTLAMVGEVVGEDARPGEGLHQLELELPLPRERVAQGELDLFAVIAHLLEPGRLQPVGGPRADS